MYPCLKDGDLHWVKNHAEISIFCSGVSLFGAGVEIAALHSVWCQFSYRLLGQVYELLLGIMD